MIDQDHFPISRIDPKPRDPRMRTQALDGSAPVLIPAQSPDVATHIISKEVSTVQFRQPCPPVNHTANDRKALVRPVTRAYSCNGGSSSSPAGGGPFGPRVVPSMRDQP